MPEFTLDDFAEQIRKLKKLGSIKELLRMIPGMGARVEEIQIDEKEIVHIEAIIRSMTPVERVRPEVISSNRRERIAKGSGTSRTEVDELIEHFEIMKKFIK
jgi:signal recognition particle subunit SRP54